MEHVNIMDIRHLSIHGTHIHTHTHTGASGRENSRHLAKERRGAGIHNACREPQGEMRKAGKENVGGG